MDSIVNTPLEHEKSMYWGCATEDYFWYFLKIEKSNTLATCEMFHQYFHVYSFVLPQCLTVLYNAAMW